MGKSNHTEIRRESRVSRRYLLALAALALIPLILAACSTEQVQFNPTPTIGGPGEPAVPQTIAPAHSHSICGRNRTFRIICPN
jgi:hypothetical protein